MKTSLHFTYSLIIILFLSSLFGCGDSTLGIDVINRSNELRKMTKSGIQFPATVDKAIGNMKQGPGHVLADEFFDIIDTWDKYDVNNIVKTDIYIDCSGGVDYGMKKTQDYLIDITTGIMDDFTYYAIKDDGINIFEPEITDPLEAYNQLINPENYVGYYSKLIPALEKCTEQTENVSIFVTDFLLDEGKKGIRNNTNISGKIQEDNSPWGMKYFTNYFKNNNVLEIIAVEYAAERGKYGCRHTNDDCNKYIYYMFFTPVNLVGKNLSTIAIIDKMKAREGAKYFKIDPLSFGFQNEDISGVGNVSFTYSNSKRHQTLSDKKYQVQFVPFNINMLRKDLKSRDNDMFEDTKIIDNLTLYDRKNKESSPYNIEVKADFYDITDVFYELNSINKVFLNEKMTFDPNNYPNELRDQTGSKEKLTKLRELDNKVNNIFSFDEENHSVILKVDNLNTSAFLESEVGYGKLYLCDIYIDRCKFTEYKDSFLQWKFHVTTRNNYIGELQNTALIESLNTALSINENEYKNKILYSYIIAINDQK